MFRAADHGAIVMKSGYGTRMLIPTTADPAVLAPATNWRTEAGAMLQLAWPMALTQVGQVAMLTTDLVMIGRLGDTALAAASLGHTVLFAAFVIGMGLMSAVAPLAAQGLGAGRPEEVRRALAAGAQTALLFGLPASIALLWAEPVLLALGQANETSRLAAEYLQGMTWCLLPAWLFIALRGVMGALERPGAALWITLAAVILNAVLAYALIFGAAGLPPLGILGAGVATTVVNTGMCVAALLVVRFGPAFRDHRCLAAVHRVDIAMMRRLLRVGLPIAVAFLLEFGLFAAAALLAGRIGTSALAAHQIALQTAAILFMVPLGIGMAATVRVGHAYGRGDIDGVVRAGWTAFALGASAMAVLAAVVVAARNVIPHIFLDTAATPATVSLAAQLLLLGAGFAIFDGLQTIGASVLRGLNDTRVPMWLSLASYWIVGFTGAVMLGFGWSLGAIGIWMGLALGLGAFALSLMIRFHSLTGRLAHAGI